MIKVICDACGREEKQPDVVGRIEHPFHGMTFFNKDYVFCGGTGCYCKASDLYRRLQKDFEEMLND